MVTGPAFPHFTYTAPRRLLGNAADGTAGIHREPAPLAPGLLQRAAALRDERAALECRLQHEAGFDGRAARRVGELSGVAQALDAYEVAQRQVAELRGLLVDRTLDAELRALAEDELVTATEAEARLAADMQRALVPAHPFAHLPALVEIRPGTGGGEAALFAHDLWRMYAAFCALRAWRVDVVALQANEAGDGLVEAIFEVCEPGAYDQLRLEAGVHRVQRVPATENKGRLHTSTATVMVLPSFPAGDGDGEDADAAVDMKDVRVDIMRARGAGGQHVNTTDSAVRMTHLPTGIVAAIQDSRSQLKNREKCLAVLKGRIAQRRRDERDAEELALRRGAAKVGAGRSDKMRTYNFVQNRVTDHRAAFTLHDLPGCLAGPGLARVMAAVHAWQLARDVDVLGRR